MALYSNIQALTNALDIAMERDKTIVTYGEDVGFVGGVFRATRGLQKKHGENRCFDAPIAEASLVGIAAGMAFNGLRPIVELQFQGFAYPAFQQLFCHIARFRNRTRGRFTCPMVIRMPVNLWGLKGLEHHSEAIEAMFAHVPGFKVVIPAKPSDVKGLMLAAVECDDPVIFLEPLRNYYTPKEEVADGHYTIEIGKAKKITKWEASDNPDLTIVTYGPLVYDCEAAVAKLQQEGMKIELIDLMTIHPWDEATVVASVKKTGRILVVHEAVKSFSVSSEIITTINEKCFEYLQCPPARLTGYDVTVPLYQGEHWFKITEKRIIDKVKTMMTYLA